MTLLLLTLLLPADASSTTSNEAGATLSAEERLANSDDSLDALRDIVEVVGALEAEASERGAKLEQQRAALDELLTVAETAAAALEDAIASDDAEGAALQRRKLAVAVREAHQLRLEAEGLAPAIAIARRAEAGPSLEDLIIAIPPMDGDIWFPGGR